MNFSAHGVGSAPVRVIRGNRLGSFTFQPSTSIYGLSRRAIALPLSASSVISCKRPAPFRIAALVAAGFSSRAMHVKRHLSYAQGYLGLGMVAEAAAELDRIAPSEREAPEVIAIRMAVLHEEKNWTALAALAGDFVRRTPGEPSAWITWAYATRRCDSLEAAERILLEAERQHPEEPTIQFNLGCYACLRGDLVLAKRRVDRAIALDPKFRDAAATDPDLTALRAVKKTRRKA